MICSTEPDHFESESLFSEVGRSAKTDRQVDPADGLCSLFWHDPMEAPDAGLEARPLDPQDVEGLGIDDVKAATAIHEHLGEACVGDNGIDNKRVDPDIGDVIWVIITVESDGHLGLVKEEGGCRLHGENLSTFSLALACREARRGSSIYHEAVVDLGEPLFLVVSLGIFLLVVLLEPMPSKYLQSMW
jgi:hypothetical protein